MKLWEVIKIQMEDNSKDSDRFRSGEFSFLIDDRGGIIFFEGEDIADAEEGIPLDGWEDMSEYLDKAIVLTKDRISNLSWKIKNCKSNYVFSAPQDLLIEQTILSALEKMR